MLNINVDSSTGAGGIDLSMKGTIPDISFELAIILSSVIGAIEEDTDKETGDEIRKGIIKYLVTSIKEGDMLQSMGSKETVSMDGNAYEFLKKYAKNKERFE